MATLLIKGIYTKKQHILTDYPSPFEEIMGDVKSVKCGVKGVKRRYIGSFWPSNNKRRIFTLLCCFTRNTHSFLFTSQRAASHPTHILRNQYSFPLVMIICAMGIYHLSTVVGRVTPNFCRLFLHLVSFSQTYVLALRENFVVVFCRKKLPLIMMAMGQLLCSWVKRRQGWDDNGNLPPSYPARKMT